MPESNNQGAAEKRVRATYADVLNMAWGGYNFPSYAGFLEDPAPANGGGAAGEGGNNGNGGGNTPQYVTLEQVQQTINNAINGFDRRLQAELPKTFESTLNAALEKAGIKPPVSANGGNGNGAGSPPANNGATALEAAVATERAERQKLEKQMQELTAEREREKQQAIEAQRNSEIKSILASAGVRNINVASAALREMVVHSQINPGTFVVKGSQGEEIALSQFVTGWLQQNPELLPPKAGSGSGAASGNGAGSGGSKVTLEDIKPGAKPETLDAAARQLAQVLGYNGQ